MIYHSKHVVLSMDSIPYADKTDIPTRYENIKTCLRYGLERSERQMIPSPKWLFIYLLIFAEFYQYERLLYNFSMQEEAGFY